MSLFNELKRRNVIRVAMAYVVAAWLIIQVVETILPAYGLGDAAIRLVVTVLAIAFVPTLIFSWVFEITPEGLKREVDVVREHSITRFTGKKLDRIIIMMLALALGYFAFDKFILDPVEDAELVEETAQLVRSDLLAESYGDRSIAVLPFVNMSSDPEQEYFSDGISEELLNLLSRIPKLRVISRSSAFSFKGKDIDIPTIAEQLNVAYVLEGSVRKAGNLVRITAQLIEARSDTHLWSETYDRELENIFVIQDEISAAITEALAEPLELETEPAWARTTTSTDAHDAYLRGRHLVVKRGKAAIIGAVSEFEKAVAHDPEYALAHAELAMAILLQARRRNYGDLSDEDAIAMAAPHVKQALTLDPNLAEAHAARASLLLLSDDREEALVHFQKAVKINPNYASVYNWMAGVLQDLGQYKEAFSMFERGFRLDPLFFPVIYNYIAALRGQNRLEEAERELDKIKLILPGLYAYQQGEMKGLGGRWANIALGLMESSQFFRGMSQGAQNYFSWIFAVLGLEEEAITVTDAIDPFVLQLLGRPEEAVALAEVSLTDNPSFLYGRRDLGLALALAAAGDYDRARPIFEASWQQSGGLVTGRNGFSGRHAAALAAIRLDAGDEAGVREMVAAIRDNVRRLREAGRTRASFNGSVDFEEGFADFLAGEHEKGLELIAKAAEDGYFIPPNSAYLQTLYEDPEFAPILAGQEARQVRERNRFLAVFCNDNPYVELWQPAEGTCDRFATEQVD